MKLGVYQVLLACVAFQIAHSTSDVLAERENEVQKKQGDVIEGSQQEDTKPQVGVQASTANELNVLSDWLHRHMLMLSEKVPVISPPSESGVVNEVNEQPKRLSSGLVFPPHTTTFEIYYPRLRSRKPSTDTTTDEADKSTELHKNPSNDTTTETTEVPATKTSTEVTAEVFYCRWCNGECIPLSHPCWSRLRRNLAIWLPTGALLLLCVILPVCFLMCTIFSPSEARDSRGARGTDILVVQQAPNGVTGPAAAKYGYHEAPLPYDEMDYPSTAVPMYHVHGQRGIENIEGDLPSATTESHPKVQSVEMKAQPKVQSVEMKAQPELQSVEVKSHMNVEGQSGSVSQSAHLAGQDVVDVPLDDAKV